MRRVYVQNQIKGIVVVRNLMAETTQVKIILDVIIINLAEELVPTQVAEPRYPRGVLPFRTTDLRFFAVCV